MTTAVFEINGQAVIVNDVDPHCTLLGWLRASGRTGAKEGCAEGECGACAVAMLSRDTAGRPCFQTVNSCLISLADAHGRSFVSVEGVAAPSGLHPIQQALASAGGSQCGYCTPGFVMSLFSEYYRPARDGFDLEAISGNLCRCTGYRPIVDAARSLPIASPEDPWLERLQQAPSELPRVDASAAQRFARPDSLGSLLELYARHPEAVLIAGGTDVMVDVNLRDARHPLLVSLGAVRELARHDWKPHEITLGAALSLSELDRQLRTEERHQELRAIMDLLPLFSSRLIRNRATLGGNLATASPIGDAAPALLALGAELTLASARGERRMPLSAFFTGYRRTALERGELIASVHLPRPLPELQRFYKVSKRTLDDISTVSAAFTLDLENGKVARLTAAYGGVAATPLRALAVEHAAQGKPWNAATLRSLLAEVERTGTPKSDHRGSGAYRSAMMQKLLERFFADTALAESRP